MAREGAKDDKKRKFESQPAFALRASARQPSLASPQMHMRWLAEP
jgi:hypothetical protein